jgi:phosphoribosylcarboxyaminoimidazole (NCAIR) mutase
MPISVFPDGAAMVSVSAELPELIICFTFCPVIGVQIPACGSVAVLGVAIVAVTTSSEKVIEYVSDMTVYLV